MPLPKNISFWNTFFLIIRHLSTKKSQTEKNKTTQNKKTC